MIGNTEICCTVQIRGYLRTQYSLGKLSLHHNSISVRLKKWNFVGGIHQFMLFALYSHLEISIVEREIRFFETGNFFPVFKWPIRVFPWLLIFFYRTKFTIDWLHFLKHNFSKVCLLSVHWNNAQFNLILLNRLTYWYSILLYNIFQGVKIDDFKLIVLFYYI